MSENQNLPVVGKPLYKKWWGIILLLFIWPYYLIWFAWKKSSWNKGTKVAVTVAAVFFVLWSISLVNSTPDTQIADSKDANTSQNTNNKNAEDAPTEAKTNSTPTPEPTPNVPTEYKSALNKATSYANNMNMSKQGVYDQLVSEYGEKFSAEAAQYAIDNVKADWNANALAKAKSYQDTMSMSPAAIHDQLTSEHGEEFTQAEADYAIQHLND